MYLSFESGTQEGYAGNEGTDASISAGLVQVYGVEGGVVGKAAYYANDRSVVVLERFGKRRSADITLLPVLGEALGDSWTVSAWVKNAIGKSAGPRVLFEGSGTSGDGLVVTAARSDTLGTSSGGTETVFAIETDSSEVFVSQDMWHHIVGVGADNKTFYYVDGLYVGTAGFQSTNDVYSVGNSLGGGEVFADYVDEVGVWTRALTGEEVWSLYASTLCQGGATTTTSTSAAFTSNGGGSGGGSGSGSSTSSTTTSGVTETSGMTETSGVTGTMTATMTATGTATVTATTTGTMSTTATGTPLPSSTTTTYAASSATTTTTTVVGSSTGSAGTACPRK